MSRSRSSISDATLEAFLRVHIANFDGGAHLTSNLDELVESYSDFFVAVSKSTTRLNSGMLRVAVSKVYSMSPPDARIVAQQLCNDYQHFSAKRRQMRNGERLSDAALRVIRASPSPVQNSTPASSPPPAPLQVTHRRNH